MITLEYSCSNFRALQKVEITLYYDNLLDKNIERQGEIKLWSPLLSFNNIRYCKEANWFLHYEQIKLNPMIKYDVKHFISPSWFPSM